MEKKNRFVGATMPVSKKKATTLLIIAVIDLTERVRDA
jgi:hypothetical protein